MSGCHCLRKRIWMVWAVLISLGGAMGVSCDQNAQAVFRQTATQPIANGVKTLVGGDPAGGVTTALEGVLDGVVAAILQAGDGPATK